MRNMGKYSGVFLVVFLAIFPLFASAAACPNLTRNLALGFRGTDVIQLQQFLISQNLLAMDSATGYFGRLTETAVKSWQKRNSIVSSGTPSTTGYGALGPKTRTAIARQCLTATTIESARSSPPDLTPYSRPAIPADTTNVPVPNTCTAETQTRALACSTGQTGLITQTRTSLCPGPTWDAWATTANTCSVATASPPNWSQVPSDMPGLITHMYECALNREPAQSDVSTWVQYFTNHHHAMANVANAFFKGAEYASRGRSKEQYIADLYHCILFRDADSASVSAWAALLTSTDYSLTPQLIGFAGSPEFAATIAPKLPFLQTAWSGTIDMQEVVYAFAKNHPHQAKQRTAFELTPGSFPYAHDLYYFERPYRNDVIGVDVDEASGNVIYGWITTIGSMVGFKGTFPIVPGKVVPDAGSWWDPMVPISDRYVTQSDVGKQFKVNLTTSWQTKTGEDQRILAGTAPVANDLNSFGVKDFGGNIGIRWYVAYTTDLSVTPTYTEEWNFYDLGPAQGVYDPEYGLLEYGQTHMPNDPNGHMYETFGKVVDYDPHGSFFNYLCF